MNKACIFILIIALASCTRNHDCVCANHDTKQELLPVYTHTVVVKKWSRKKAEKECNAKGGQILPDGRTIVKCTVIDVESQF